MSNRHEPHDAFVAQLEERLRADLGRRRLTAPAPRWLPRSTRGLVLATAAVVIVSMAIGGGVVSAAYQAQQGAQRDALVKTHVMMVDLAARRLALARQQLQEEQARVSVGIQSVAAVNDARFKVTEAETEMRLVELDLAEVHASGREPVKTVSAPLVSGRDFVAERWQVEATVPAAALDAAKRNVDVARTRLDVGLANSQDVEMAGSRLIELEGAIQLAQRKIGIRQAFVKRELTAAVAELRVMEVETEQRHAVLARRIAFSRRQLQDVKLRTEIGTAGAVELAEAELRLQELQLALTKAEYDLALIRKQLGK